MNTRVLTSHLPTDLAKKRRRLMLEALADVKAGRTHDHAEIEAWAASLEAPKRRARR